MSFLLASFFKPTQKGTAHLVQRDGCAQVIRHVASHPGVLEQMLDLLASEGVRAPELTGVASAQGKAGVNDPVFAVGRHSRLVVVSSIWGKTIFEIAFLGKFSA